MPETVRHICRLFIFDLDGTLIDSKSDIAASLNRALARMKFDPLPESRIVEFIGEGISKLVQRALAELAGREPTDALLRSTTEAFAKEYSEHMLDTTRLYPAVSETLDRLPWAQCAVVSNKLEKFSRKILEHLEIADRFRLILGGDSTLQRKPDPAPLLECMRQCQVSPAETAMVGDSGIDVAAGKAAGVLTCGVTTGFRGREELEESGCDIIIADLRELPEHFVRPRDL